MNCFFCHNRALLADSGPILSMSDALSFLESRKGLLDGVVISGGEPTLHGDLPDVLRTIREMGFKTKLDTNGANTQNVLSLADDGLLDYVAVDFKAPKDDYGWVTGDHGGYEKARETILGLNARSVPFEARCTLYPGLTIEKLIEILGAIPPLTRLRLNLFRQPEQYDLSHAFLLRRSSLTEVDLKQHMEELLSLQPGLYY